MPAPELPRVHLGNDSASIDLSAYLRAHLRSRGYEVFDHGPTDDGTQDDDLGYAVAVAEAVRRDHVATRESLGIVVGGSGVGEQIAVNKVAGIRGALVWNADTAVLARAHYDANIAIVGTWQSTEPEILDLIKTFVAASFSGAELYVRRIDQINEFERQNYLRADMATPFRRNL